MNLIPPSNIGQVDDADTQLELKFLHGGGEMGLRIRQFQWSAHPLGPPSDWPQSLKTAVCLILRSQHPMWIGWGTQMWFLYNDAYVHVLGHAKHGWALGRPAAQVWAEIWDICGPLADKVFSLGQASFVDDVRLFMNRGAFLEETYYSFSYSPIFDESGNVGGLFCPSNDVSPKVIGARRLRTLSELSGSALVEKTVSRACAMAAASLARNADDIPFAMLYVMEDGKAVLKETVRIDPQTDPFASVVFETTGGATPQHLDDVLTSKRPKTITFVDAAASLPSGPRDQPVRDGLVLPVISRVTGDLMGVLIAAVSPARRLDSDYAVFFELISANVGTAIDNARAAEEEKRRADALAELDRAKTAFFSNISHEFRTPLTLLLGPIEEMLALPAGNTLGEVRDSIEVIHRNALRLQKLVNTLLDFSRLEAGRVQANYVSTDLGTLTAELASSFRSAMDRAGIAYRIQASPLSLPVFVDREMWEKIVLNLISNAFKYTLAGSVTVEVSERDGRAEFSVADTGVGIPQHELPRIFERFHRVESVRGRTHEGTGIGLALVYELVRLHGGSLTVQSAVGEGSTFTVSLPLGSSHLPQDRIGTGRSSGGTALHPESYLAEALRWLEPDDYSASRNEIEVELPRAHPKRNRVLVADDNADMREYIRRLLETRYTVTTAANGKAALEMALSSPPDLILTDIMMPELDGFELLRGLRSQPATKTLPIILLSARAGEESRVEGLDAGADDYLVKPFAARELLARVDAHLSLARMRREADEARRLSEVRLGLALESAKTVAWEWDPSEDRVIATGDMKSIFGTEVRNSREALALVCEEYVAEHKAKVERVAHEGGSYFSEFRIRRADTHESVWLEERAAALIDERGTITRVAGVLTDITPRKAIEQQIRERNAELERANSELEEYAYVASHDLREPLRTINIYTELLLRKTGLRDDPQWSKFTTPITGGVKQMELLINDLLCYARVVHREQDPMTAVPLNDAITQALDAIDGLTTSTNAVITYQPNDALVCGDGSQLAQVFQNLLSNSIKYRTAGRRPRIAIETHKADREWLISVADNGIGFNPEYSEKIFGLFKRLHKDQYPGTGLGLAICKRVVERYGGRIWARSDGEGKGATFWVALRRGEN